MNVPAILTLVFLVLLLVVFSLAEHLIDQWKKRALSAEADLEAEENENDRIAEQLSDSHSDNITLMKKIDQLNEQVRRMSER